MSAPANHVLPAVQQRAWDELWRWLLAPEDEPTSEQKETPLSTDLAAGESGAGQRVSDHDGA